MRIDNSYFRRKADGTLAESYLIQRLEKPRGGFLAGAFSFGGGMKNGGLSDEAMGLLQGIFSFDYMGSSEFEWGSVPYALSQIAGDIEGYETFEVEVDLSKVPAHWKRKGELGEGFKDVYVIAQKGDREEYTKRILKWASEAYNSGMKETTHLARTLRPVEEWDNDVQGWLDVSNGVFFFTDFDMFMNTAKLFGLDSDLFN
jgi:hypothetical protein